MRRVISGYAGLKSRIRRDAVTITKTDCKSLYELLNKILPLPDGWLPPLSYRAFISEVSRAIRLEVLKPHIPELVSEDSLLQICVNVSGLVKFYGELPQDQSIQKNYRVELLSDCLDRRSKLIRLVQKTSYISEGLSLLDESTELHYRIKPTRTPSSLVERNYQPNIFDQLVVIDDTSVANYEALASMQVTANTEQFYSNEFFQSSDLMVPIDLVAMILMSALHKANPEIYVKTLRYHAYGQLYTGNSLRICASCLSDREILIWAESGGNIIYRGVVGLG